MMQDTFSNVSRLIFDLEQIKKLVEEKGGDLEVIARLDTQIRSLELWRESIRKGGEP